MRRHLGVALLLAVLLAACTITVDDAEQSEEAPVKPVWDLRNSHRIEDVGWPQGHDGSTYKVDAPPGELTILLPGGVTIEGPFDVIANRPLRLAEGEDRSVLEYLVVNYDREPVRDAARLPSWPASGVSTPRGLPSGLPETPMGGTTAPGDPWPVLARRRVSERTVPR